MPPAVSTAGRPARKRGQAAAQEALVSEKPHHHAENERERIAAEEDKVTVDSDESFPASDPPSFNPGVVGATAVKKKKQDAKH